ncbi:hypothetical protein IW261DRAFT_1422910 [Armillaria novae-zelandiae]|uniref:Uncharacterized protein n=1 Tax=Armillaria novae-zelandiae TaxID=153914 RepID=A0AA39NZK9_9AGAR|nr:hypothetical protein IW261DRAFT_1422910 [Armillaria novae-zelandiae]
MAHFTRKEHKHRRHLKRQRVGACRSNVEGWACFDSGGSGKAYTSNKFNIRPKLNSGNNPNLLTTRAINWTTSQYEPQSPEADENQGQSDVIASLGAPTRGFELWKTLPVLAGDEDSCFIMKPNTVFKRRNPMCGLQVARKDEASMAKIERSAEEVMKVPIPRYPNAFHDLVPTLWPLRAMTNVQEFGRKIFLMEQVKCTVHVHFVSVFEDGNNEPPRMNVTAFSTCRGTLHELGCHPCTRTVPVHNQKEFRPEYLYKLERNDIVFFELRLITVPSIELYANFWYLTSIPPSLSPASLASVPNLTCNVARRDGISVSIRPGIYKSWSLKFDQMEWRLSEFGGVILMDILIPVIFTRTSTKQRNGPGMNIHRCACHCQWGWRHVDQNNMQIVEKFRLLHHQGQAQLRVSTSLHFVSMQRERLLHCPEAASLRGLTKEHKRTGMGYTEPVGLYECRLVRLTPVYRHADHRCAQFRTGLNLNQLQNLSSTHCWVVSTYGLSHRDRIQHCSLYDLSDEMNDLPRRPAEVEVSDACPICRKEDEEGGEIKHCDNPYNLLCLTPPLTTILGGEWFFLKCIRAPVGRRLKADGDFGTRKVPPSRARKAAPKMLVKWVWLAWIHGHARKFEET